MTFYDKMSLGKRIKFICGIMITGFGLFPFLIIMGAYSAGNDPGLGLWVWGIVETALGIYLLYDAIKGKEKISYSTFQKYKEPKIYAALSNNCSRYKDYLVNDDEAYMYNELCKKFPSLFAEYAHQILSAPLEMYKPVSSTTAAYVGTRIQSSRRAPARRRRRSRPAHPGRR